jgi:hypothetical protein
VKNKYYILDENRKPLPVNDVTEWARQFEKTDRVIRKSVIGKFTVSTVFLGLDHSFYGGPPLLYESMVFNSSDDFMRRYATEKEAVEGHEQICEMIQGFL